MSNDKDLTKEPVTRALIAISAPMSIGILGVLSVGLADAFFLARAGEDALTAIGFIYPVIVALTSLSIGLGAGTNTVVSQSIGGGDDNARQTLALHAMIVALALSSAVSAAVWIGAPWLFGLLGAKGSVLQDVLAYMPWWCLSFPTMVTGMALNAVFRASGNTTVPAAVMLVQSAINIALDPLLIFGLDAIPAFGIEGAGIATFIARLAGFAIVVAYGIRNGAITLAGAPFKGLAASARKIARVGGPASLSNAINPAGMAAVTAAVAMIGDAAVAGFGAATRVQSLLFVPMLALSAGIGPVVGQKLGRG